MEFINCSYDVFYFFWPQIRVHRKTENFFRLLAGERIGAFVKMLERFALLNRDGVVNYGRHSLIAEMSLEFFSPVC